MDSRGGHTRLAGSIEAKHEEPHLLVTEQTAWDGGERGADAGGTSSSPRVFDRLAPMVERERRDVL